MLYIASDHAGYSLKNRIIKLCKENNIQIIDAYTNFDINDDYPDISTILAEKIYEDDDNLGIATCGTAEGICMGLNRYNFIRAATVDTPHITKLVKEHNNANVICIPGPYSHKNFTDKQLLEIIETFIYTKFEQDTERHLRRVGKLSRLPLKIEKNI